MCIYFSNQIKSIPMFRRYSHHDSQLFVFSVIQFFPKFTSPEDKILQFAPDVTYPPAPLCCIYPCWRSAMTLSVGGGFIESFAFGVWVCWV